VYPHGCGLCSYLQFMQICVFQMRGNRKTERKIEIEENRKYLTVSCVTPRAVLSVVVCRDPCECSSLVVSYDPCTVVESNCGGHSSIPPSLLSSRLHFSLLPLNMGTS
jgi:hypothetical protein